jgi:hypothetical protein
MIMWWWVGMFGCGAPPRCETADAPLASVGAEVLRCDEARVAPRYVVRLSGRALQAGDEEIALEAVRDRFLGDPDGTRAWLTQLAAAGARLEGPLGLEGAAARSHAVWEAAQGTGAIDAGDGALWNLQGRTLSVWVRDDEEQLALTESDIEGLIRYASLCREAQGAEPLRVSIGDRTALYQMAVDAFRGGERSQQVAMTAFGVYWPEVRARWDEASYEDQQAWLAAAPLPPPMSATSLGYAEAVLTGDWRAHAVSLHQAIGPLSLGWGEPSFVGEGTVASAPRTPRAAGVQLGGP